MTPEPDARCVVTRSAVRGTIPSPGVYEVVKISTTVGPTLRAVASSELLRSVAAFATRDGACANAADATKRLTKTTANNALRLLGDIGLTSITRAGPRVHGSECL